MYCRAESVRGPFWDHSFFSYTLMTYRIVSCTHILECMYADDTHLKLADNNIDSIELNLNKDLVSISKCLLALYPFLKIDGAPADQSGAQHENLTWNVHIENLSVCAIPRDEDGGKVLAPSFSVFSYNTPFILPSHLLRTSSYMNFFRIQCNFILYKGPVIK